MHCALDVDSRTCDAAKVQCLHSTYILPPSPWPTAAVSQYIVTFFMVSVGHNAATWRNGADIRDAITQHRFPEFVRGFVAEHHPDGDGPAWVRTGLELAGIGLEGDRV